MWTSSQTKRMGEKARAYGTLGLVTAGGKESSVLLEMQRRAVPVAAPGGYRWRPEAGEQVLVLKTGADGEAAWILGRTQESGEELLPGEVELVGRSCGIKLTCDGGVELRGEVRMNGAKLEDMIRAAVAQVLAQEG